MFIRVVGEILLFFFLVCFSGTSLRTKIRELLLGHYFSRPRSHAPKPHDKQCQTKNTTRTTTSIRWDPKPLEVKTTNTT